MQVRYQAALRPEKSCGLNGCEGRNITIRAVDYKPEWVGVWGSTFEDLEQLFELAA